MNTHQVILKIGNIELGEEFFFDFIFCFWFFTEIFSQANFETFFGVEKQEASDIIAVIVFVLLLLLIILNRDYTLQEAILILIVTAFISIATITSQMNSLICGWMFIVAAKKIKLRKMVKLAFFMLVFTISLIILLYFAGIIPEKVIYRGTTLRHSLGFSHPNQFSLRLFQLQVCYFYLRQKRMNILDFIVLGVLTFMTFQFSNSQTAFVCSIALIILALLSLLKNETFQKVFSNILWIGGIGAAAFSLIFTYTGVSISPIIMAIDSLISARLYWGHTIYTIYGSTIFGQKIYVSAEERAIAGIHRNLYLDGTYPTLWLRGGIIMLVLFLIGYFGAFRKLRKVPALCVILFVYSVYGIMEQGLMSLTHNVFLLCIAWFIYRDKPIEDAAS